MPAFEELKVFSGMAHPELANAICRYLGVSLGKSTTFKFKNDNTFFQFQENIRERDVFLIQPLAYPVNDHVMELLIMMDAARRASAGRITAVVPYYSYGRTDKKDQPRVPITARLLADLITVAGADRLLTMDLHAGQIQGFFNIPVDELNALPILAREFKQKDLEDVVVVATDVGGARLARDMAHRLDAPVAIVEKRRLGNLEQVEAMSIIGEVKDKTALIVDDEIVTGGTIFSAVDLLRKEGVKSIYCTCIHGILPDPTLDRVIESPIIEFLVTDTLPIKGVESSKKLKVVTVAPLLGEAIHRIHNGLSVGAMFE